MSTPPFAVSSQKAGERGKDMCSIKGASEEFFGSVSDGLIKAAKLKTGGVWARKTTLPTNITDIVEYRSAYKLPEDIQKLCDTANNGWAYGTDRYWAFSP